MLAVCLSAAASLTSVVTVPVFVNAAFRLFPSAHAPVQLSVLSAAIGLLLVSMLPVAAGMALRWRRPAAARTVQARMGLPALLVVVGIILATIWSVKADLMPALVGAGAPALVLNVSGVAVAWGAAAWLGLDAPQRIAVGLECGLQNFAMAAFVALTLLSDTPLLLPGIAYGLTMYLSAGAVVLLARRRVQP
jgi:BASS family bile acid:Na+ symporter